MRLTICLTAAAILCAGSTPLVAKTAKPAFQLDGTTWIFTDKKDGKIKESIDADGNYISQTIRGKHVDHGTAVMKGDKACFTSKMNEDGEMCWTTTPVAVGHSFVATNDKGGKLRVSRVAYTKLSMPK